MQSGVSPKDITRSLGLSHPTIYNWLKKAFTKLKGRAKQEKANIFFAADEAGVRSDFHSGTKWASVGQAPVFAMPGARFSVNMISAVSPRGDFQFMVVEGSVTAGVFIESMKRLLVGSKKRFS